MSTDDVLRRFGGFLERNWDAVHRFEASERAAALPRLSAEVTCREFMALYGDFEAQARASPIAAADAARRIELLARRERAFLALTTGER